MTDRFESLIRDAAQADGPPLQTPTYHGAWRRGRRRRLLKRGGIAGAGVVLVAAGLSIGLLGPISTTIEADLAVAPVATVTADQVGDDPAATTVPLVAPEPDEAPEIALADPEFEMSRPDTEAGEPETTTPDSASETEAPDSDPQAATENQVPIPAGEPSPSPSAPAVNEPDGTEAARPETTDPEATPEATATEPADLGPPLLSTGSGPDADPTATGAPTATGVPQPTLTPAPGAVTEPDPMPDEGDEWFGPGPQDTTVASVISDHSLTTDGGYVPCDTTGDGAADAQCELFPLIGCTSSEGLAPEYVEVDTDGDRRADLCVVPVDTWCDQTGDWVGDVHCLIRG